MNTKNIYGNAIKIIYIQTGIVKSIFYNLTGNPGELSQRHTARICANSDENNSINDKMWDSDEKISTKNCSQNYCSHLECLANKNNEVSKSLNRNSVSDLYPICPIHNQLV